MHFQDKFEGAFFIKKTLYFVDNRAITKYRVCHKKAIGNGWAKL